jgi:NAD(P)-dependent dehydrogenase (short-subunit alcohol dehydrogenase family)
MSHMGRLEGKVAIITGGASGMGAAMVKRFRQEGAEVISSDIQEAAGQSVAEGVGALFLRQDVSEEEGWKQITDLARERFGRLDVVINNAGIVTGKSIQDVDMDTWHRVIGINLTGVMLGCKYGIATMVENPGGSSGALINIASTTAFTALPGDVGYTAAKSGVRMLSKSVAVHCGQQGLNIRSNCIVPGAIQTGIIDKAAEEIPGLIEHLASISPLNRIGQGEDIAGAAVYLASDDASFVTGIELQVDGGALAVHPGY